MSSPPRARWSRWLKGGRARKADNGGFAYGSPPLGWRADAGGLVEVPAEQAALALIRQRHEARDSLRVIGAALELAGHEPKRGTRWHPGVLRRILARSQSPGGGSV